MSPVDLSDRPFAQLLESIAAKTPTPGGGAVAATTGALGSALARMVVNYSVEKKELAPRRAELEQALQELSRSAALFLEIAQDDARAYERLSDALKLPRDDPARESVLHAAAEHACRPPLRALAHGAALLEQLLALSKFTNRMLRSDLAIAGILVEAASRASAWNISANFPLLAPARGAELREEAQRLAARARQLAAELESACI